jgi:hypothetical protein
MSWTDAPPLPASGERVGVRGSHLYCDMLLPLTLTLSPSRVQSDRERE